MEILLVEERLSLADRSEAQTLKVKLDALRLDASLAQQQYEIDRVANLEQLADEMQRKLDLIRQDDRGKHTEVPEGVGPNRGDGRAIKPVSQLGG